MINALGTLYEEESTMISTLRVLRHTLLVAEASDIFDQNDGVKLMTSVVTTFYNSLPLQVEAM